MHEARSEKRAQLRIHVPLGVCGDELLNPWRAATIRRGPPAHDNTMESPTLVLRLA
jgi:hypothetical protein